MPKVQLVREKQRIKAVKICFIAPIVLTGAVYVKGKKQLIHEASHGVLMLL